MLRNSFYKTSRQLPNVLFRSLSSASPNNTTLIIGGGPIGLCTAYHLALSSPGSNITVLERDPTYARASATLSAGGIRQQFSLRQNVQMSIYGRDFLRSAHEILRVDEEEVDVQFQERGYLFLASTDIGAEVMRRNHQVQVGEGADVKLLNCQELKEKFPWLNTSDILLGSYGETGEGWFDPWILLRALKWKCQSLGVTIFKGYPIGASRDSDTGQLLSVDVIEQYDGKELSKKYNVDNVVNATGAHCARLMEILAGEKKLMHPIPVEPRKRCIFFFHCATDQKDIIVPRIAPLTICPISNVYFRSEGHVEENGEATGNFLCGVSPTKEKDRAVHDMTDIDYADHELWDEIIWPSLYHRVPAFGEVKLKSSWAGFYEYNTIDQNAIIDFHPEIPNVLMACGFSGHGLQQAPAAGRAAAELLASRQFQTIDLEIFSFDRCYGKKPPVFELGIV
ncbi:hypothetical protein ACHAW6_016189 [Cyclotella cf. meneghiniana]